MIRHTIESIKREARNDAIDEVLYILRHNVDKAERCKRGLQPSVFHPRSLKEMLPLIEALKHG